MRTLIFLLVLSAPLLLPLAAAEPINPRPLCEGQVFDLEHCPMGARVYVCGYQDALQGFACLL